MSQETQETEERTEQPERAAPPRFSEYESPPAWLISTRGDLRETEARVNHRIDDVKGDIRTRIDDSKAETNARIDSTNARIDELKAEGRARDAVLDAHTGALARIEAKLESDNLRKHLTAVWIGITVAAVAMIVNIIMQLAG